MGKLSACGGETDLTFQTERQATYEVRDNAYKLLNERPEGFPSLLESLIKAGEERSKLEETPLIDMRPHYNYEVSHCRILQKKVLARYEQGG